MHYFVSCVNISVLLATIVKKNLRNNWIESCECLSVIHYHDRMVRKANDVSAGDWQYQTRKKLS